ncbi:conjugative transposon protein TraN [Flavobacterium notoginsengisoli]|uniref:conjugative transposon protein TraN n=1 Tax=Flavobacterium notoginsengisoli TaxID=1478199 RepID=UPI0036269C4B
MKIEIKMKKMESVGKRNWIVIMGLLLNVMAVFGQGYKNTVLNQEELKNLQIACSKTTSIVFPYAVKSLDKGSADVLVQKAKGVENIILVKAARQHFVQTNLTVVTADNRLYVFMLNYEETCPDLNVKADYSYAVNESVLFSKENDNQKQIEQYAGLALSKKKSVSGLNCARFEMSLRVSGIFIHQDVLFFRLVLGNRSRINYDIDQLRFFIRDQRKSKRTASQEIELLPLYCTSLLTTVPDKSEVTLVYALSKFTIPEKKYLTIQLIEKNGGRQIEVDIKNRDIMNLDILNGI